MKRREFITSSVILASSMSFLNSCSQDESKNSNDFLSGFIISDAHIGWKGQDQPSLDTQKQAVKTIKSKFPNLDLVFDTGDIHHGYLNEDERIEARNQWLTGFANPFSRALFHYIPGNHELGKGAADTEITATKLGSQNLRPYYSFDYKGIHFVSLPELMDTILVNRESLEWLEFDLSLNRDKTTMIFSHNSLIGTTFTNGQTGYRSVVNSDEVFNIINRYKNVVAWLHGHNHQYEIVNKENRLYVSNGRIGGFNPSKSWGNFGQGHIGGVYFAINKQGLVIKCFSTTKKDFLHNLGYKELSQKLEFKSSFNSHSGLNYYFGHGILTNNVTHKIVNYYHTNKDIKVFTKPLNNDVLNDNSDLQLPTELYFGNRRIQRIIGYDLIPGYFKRKRVPTGLYIENNSNEDLTIILPKHRIVKYDFMVRGSYFRCELGDTFNIKLKFSFPEKKTNEENLVIGYTVFNESHELLLESVGEQKILNIDGTTSIDLSIPSHKSIKPEERKYIKFSFKLLNFPKKYIVNKITLTKKVLNKQESKLIINGIQYDVPTRVSKNISMNDFQTKGLTKLKYMGKTPVSCIIKVQNVIWQVRNAISHYSNDTLELFDYNHSYQKTKEVIITPSMKHQFYLNKVTEIMPLRITYNKNHINIQLFNINHQSKLSFVIYKNPSKITGASQVIKNMEENKLEIIPKINNIQIWF